MLNAIPSRREVKPTGFDIWLYTGFLFVTTTFFFFDPESYTPKLAIVGLSWVLLAFIMTRRTFRFRSAFILLIGYLLMLQVSKFSGLERYSSLLDLLYPWGLVNAIFLFYFLTEQHKVALRVIDRYLTIFAALNIPSIFFYVALVFNVGLDYQLISLGGRESIYRNYYNLAIIRDNEIFTFGDFTISRLAGMFEEPGMLGTYVAVLLAADLIAFPGRRLRKIALLLLGLVSLSLAFYVFLFMLALYVALSRGNAKLIVISLCLFSVLLSTAPSGIRDAFSYLVIGRLNIAEGGFLEGDTRQIQFGDQWVDYLASASAGALAFGHGARSNHLDKVSYSSYQSIVYEAGFVGLALVLAFTSYFLLWLPLRNRNYTICILGIFPVLSLYQRPDFLSSYFIVIYAAVFFSSLANRVGEDKRLLGPRWPPQTPPPVAGSNSPTPGGGTKGTLVG